MSYPDPLARMLREGAAPHELVLAGKLIDVNLADGHPDPLLDHCDAAFGQPDPAANLHSPRLRWIHLSTAGYERYDLPDCRSALARRGIAMTTSSGVYDEPCAQHLLAMMLSQARQLPQALDNQRPTPGSGSPASCALAPICSAASASSSSASAPSCAGLVELLTPFKMTLAAVRRTIRGDEPIPTFTEEHIDRLLAEADPRGECPPRRPGHATVPVRRTAGLPEALGPSSTTSDAATRSTRKR